MPKYGIGRPPKFSEEQRSLIIDAPEAWAVTEGDASIIVAIIDDSVQRNHPDLAGNYKTGRYYRGLPLGETDNPSPKTGDEQHGTACAGVAVGVGNDIGIRGSAPNCGLIGIHFWHATAAQTAEAFYFAMDPDKNPETNDGASVISCSWSWNGAFDAVSGAVAHVAANGRNGRGIPILFAAGNDADAVGTHQWFCGVDGVICVGATDWRDNLSWYSNFGPQLDVVAPSSGSGAALRINTTDNTDDMPKAPGFAYSGYATGDYTGTGSDGFGGTSSATPLTAGVAALILSANPELSATDVRTILEHTADRVRGSSVPAHYDPALGHGVYYGFGRVNAKRAVHVARQAILDAGAVWPDRVRELLATQSGPNVRLNWKNPADRAAGVLVVRSDYRLAWRPYDRDRFVAGDTLPGGVGRVVSVDLREQFEEPAGGDGSRFYTLFTYNDDFSYSWGEAVEMATPLSDSQAVASGGS